MVIQVSCGSQAMISIAALVDDILSLFPFNNVLLSAHPLDHGSCGEGRLGCTFIIVTFVSCPRFGASGIRLMMV